MIAAEEKINKHLSFLYEGNTSYEELIKNLTNCIKKKNEIVQKEISSLQEAMKNKKKIEDQFKPIRPHTKEFFLKKKKMKHYEVKLPKLRDKMAAKEKLKGQLTDGDVKKLNRNEKKLKDSLINMDISAQNIVKESNRINIERFQFFNPIIGEYVSSLLSTCYLMTDSYHTLDNYENILKI